MISAIQFPHLCTGDGLGIEVNMRKGYDFIFASMIEKHRYAGGKPGAEVRQGLMSSLVTLLADEGCCNQKDCPPGAIERSLCRERL